MMTRHRTRTLHSAIWALHALEGQVAQQLRRQLDGSELSGHPDARAVLADVEPRLSAQIEALEACLSRLEGSPSRLQETLGALLGTAASWIEGVRHGEEASRTLRDDFAALSLVLIQTRMLEGVATALEDFQTLGVAQRHIQELREAIHRVEEVLPGVLFRELQEEGMVLPPAEPSDREGS